MKRASLAALLLYASSSWATASEMTWDKNLLASLKSKTLFEAICAAPQGYFSKSSCDNTQKAFLNRKIDHIERGNSNDILISESGKTITIELTKSPLIFLINKKSINIGEYRTAAELSQKIASMLPNFHASLWISQAQAADANQLMTDLQLIMSTQSDKVTCSTAHKFVKACGSGYSSPLQTSLLSTVQNMAWRCQGHGSSLAACALSPQEIQKIKDSSDQFRMELFSVSLVFSGAVMQKEKILNACPQENGQTKPVLDAMIECRDNLQKISDQYNLDSNGNPAALSNLIEFSKQMRAMELNAIENSPSFKGSPAAPEKNSQ